jgi:anti-anti-sigma regulatory factor
VIETETDPSRNLLIIRHSQHVQPEEFAASILKLRVLQSELKPGFRVLADLANLESMDTSCAPLLGEVMDMLNDSGVGLIVRIIPDAQRDIGLNILSLFHYDRKVRIVTVTTAEEAAKVLSP